MIGAYRHAEMSMNQKIWLVLQLLEAMNRHGKPTPAKMDPIRMKGRRRPQRVRVLSEIQPKSGSVNASMKRLAPSERLTWVGVSPRKTLKTGLAKLFYSQCPKISVVPPRAYAALASA